MVCRARGSSTSFGSNPGKYLMKLFLLAADIPFPRHDVKGVTAINIVLHELISNLRDLGNQIVLQVIFNENRSAPDLSSVEEQALNDLRQAGIHVLAPIFPLAYHKPKSPAPRGRLDRLKNVLMAELIDYYPSTTLPDGLCGTIQSVQARPGGTLWVPASVGSP